MKKTNRPGIKEYWSNIERAREPRRILSKFLAGESMFEIAAKRRLSVDQVEAAIREEIKKRESTEEGKAQA